jgi:excisionase family DNA binding protein
MTDTAPSPTLSLKECAERLGVHYMTAYKYVRHGKLPATKVGGEWRVSEADLEVMLSGAAIPTPRGETDWAGRIEDRLMAGDESGSWSIVEAALASGVAPEEIHVDVLAVALRSIGQGWHEGVITIAEEHRATAVATKIVGRMSNRFARRGRRRGLIVIGTPPGERHGLSIAIVADLLRGDGWEVLDLGPDMPIDEFAVAVEKAGPVSAIAVGVTNPGAVEDARALVTTLRASTTVPIIVGGAAVTATTAAHIGADGWASDGRTAVEAVAAITSR